MTTHEDTQFDAADEAFFNAAQDDVPVSERPSTLGLEAEAPETDDWPRDPAASERLRARRARLTQAVAEIVATLALLAGTAGGMHLVRGTATEACVAPAASPSSQHASGSTITGRKIPLPTARSASRAASSSWLPG